MTKRALRLSAFLAWFLPGVAVLPLHAQVPAGGWFEISDSGGTPSVAAEAAGNFVVAWKDFDDGVWSGVVARRFDASGAARGPAFRVNTYTTGCQGAFGHRGPTLASDAAGGFVVVWTSSPCFDSPAQDGSGIGVFGQRFDSAGRPRGSEFRVNTYTTGNQEAPTVASDTAGSFVVVWEDYPDPYAGGRLGIFGQRYDASGAPRGAEFRINTYTTGHQRMPVVASDAAGNFVVAWDSSHDGDGTGIFAQRYDASGTPRGAEFQVNASTQGDQQGPAIASDASGNVVLAWSSPVSGKWHLVGRRFDSVGNPVGAEFSVGDGRGSEESPSIAIEPSGDFTVAWPSFIDVSPATMFLLGRRYDAGGVPRGPVFEIAGPGDPAGAAAVASDASGNVLVVLDYFGIFGRRYGGVTPAPHTVDPAPSPSSDGNGVLEPGESVELLPAWRNVNGETQTFDGSGLGLIGPEAAGVVYELLDAAGTYGSVPNGSTAPCTDCYRVGVSFGGTRPTRHWDATFTERLTPDVLGQTKLWSLHIGESFSDVPKTSPYYPFVETLLHKGVTGGCSASSYCPTSAVTREQTAIFALVGKEHAGYLPTACTAGSELFADVPASSPFCRYVQELAARGVVGGCGNGNYCPGDPVTREQMAVFMLKTLDPTIGLPPCPSPPFGDVPVTNPFCPWIAELARRGVVSGCGDGNYCPGDPVTREQMAVFVSQTFGLSLNGP